MQLKIEVLKVLEEERGRDISGQALAERFGGSRNAIWKAVKALQAEGYKILAGQNRATAFLMKTICFLPLALPMPSSTA